MPKKSTQIGWIAGAGLGAAAAAALRRRWSGPDGGDLEPDAVDRAGGTAGERFLSRLSEAIAIRTVSHDDPGDVDAGEIERMLSFLVESYPLVHERIDREPVAGLSRLYTWKGSDPDLPPLVLMAHFDVAAVKEGTAGDWTEPPFSGARSGGYVWGRGALDDKASLVGIFEAVEGLLEDGFSPEATVYLSIGHDEEAGGSGAGSIAALLAGRGVRPGLVLDEGGAVAIDLLPGVDEPVALVGIGEKSSLSIELAARSTGGHSSTPPPTTAVGQVAAAVAALERSPLPARLEVQSGLFEALAPVLPRPLAFALRHGDRMGPLIERRLGASPATNALIRTTTAVTMIEGGEAHNVLPQQARAVVNFRIMPGDTREAVLAHVRRVVGPAVDVRPLEGGPASDPPAISDPGSEWFGAVADTIHEVFPGIAVAPWVMTTSTDSRHFVPVAETVLRFAPFTATPDDMQRIHGTDERLRVGDADRVVEFYRGLIRRVAG
jgi:carboxypeptidase PM20D1